MKISLPRLEKLFLLLVLPFISFAPADKKAMNIIFIGDSITEGSGLGDMNVAPPPAAAAAYLRTRQKARGIRFANHGVSGFTTVDFLPSTATVYPEIIRTADSFYSDKKAQLVFSIMLGTNDSAIDGPNGSPVLAESYGANMTAIIDDLLKRYPDSRIIIHYPVWYSENTYNNSRYLAEGLGRLQSYFPVIAALVKKYAGTHPRKVFSGDQSAFSYFKANYLTDMNAEKGQQGVFYLHPNARGAKKLGDYWGAAIAAALLP